MKVLRILLILLFAACKLIYSQDHYRVNIKFERLSEKVIVVSGSQFSTNQVAVCSDTGIILIDTGISPEYAAIIKDSLSNLFGTSGFAYIINTHHHWDHVQGNQVFPETDIIAHMNSETGMRAQKPVEDINRVNIRLENYQAYHDTLPPPPPSHILVDGENGYCLTVPSIAFNDRMRIKTGGITLHLIYYGECHTDNDILIYIPEVKLLAVGDLFFKNSLPQIGGGKNPDIKRWLTTLNWILNEDNPIDYVIPGHNELFTKKDLREYYDYLTNTSGGIKNEISNGRSLKYITDEFCLKNKFPGLLNKDMVSNDGLSLHDGNIKRLYDYFLRTSGNSR